ncbi:ATP-dependent zinc metalloprotease FtsH [Propionigenium maris DSM 9537]|uniref:ATP-dependent zinc metalloprotease FtsH n=1 Tax=Propionigenium maris DSM 9537 TaxID=1123000 RepID=A0A9W6GLP1_9FUSO|nr:ATP-dependent zinc metalloprotease FtsH [Propionigenium maris]GLI55857.1 ATP-dependent zinc metalloprotease FtsH [Propionigenium maris DSM 9537]
MSEEKNNNNQENNKNTEEQNKNKDNKGYNELEERKKELKAKLKYGMKKGAPKGREPQGDNRGNNQGDKKPQKENKFNFKNIVMLLFVVTIFMSIPSLMSNKTKNMGTQVKYSEFLSEVRSGNIKSIDEKEGYVYGIKQDDQEINARMISDRISQDVNLMNAIGESENIQVGSLDPEKVPFLVSIFVSWFPMLLLIGIWIFMLNKMNRGGSGGPQIFNMGKSRAKENGEEISNVNFEDVAGIEEAKQELEEVVHFLKEPEKFRRIGAKIPKGVLLLGQPGTGKTFLAKAVAGEAGVPFFSISGSEFVEMFVGVGASRVRDLFNKARKNAPCIVFIDEIDAVGRKRGAGQGGGNDEREQTLNQLLVEMDGFSTEETIIVLAATNRPEILDKALMRPGRFDRQVVVDRPDLKGREEILAVHIKGKKLAEDVDLHVIARKTPGFVGADLANMLNEAAILAARAGREEITMDDLEEASEKVSIGPERKSRVTVEKEKNIVAYHEVGHALIQCIIPHTEPVHKVTVVPRGMAALGYTMTLPTEDRYLKSKNEYLAELRTLLGGRAAEEVVFGDITTGASNDIERATAIAHAMVTKFGMTEKFGPILLDNTKEGDMFMQKYYSEATGKEIDAEISGLINEAYTEVKQLLRDNYALLDSISKTLLERETITGDELNILIEGGELEPLRSKTVKAVEEEVAEKEVVEEVQTEEKVAEETAVEEEREEKEV